MYRRLVTSLQTRYLISLLATFLLISAGGLYCLNRMLKQEAMRDAGELSRLLLERNLAVHQYFNATLKPAVFGHLRNDDDPAYFDPVWMSSTYAVRAIDREFKRQSLFDGYYYKECAINARDPNNEADPFERRFLTQLNADSALRQWEGVREIDGVPFYTVLRRGEAMETGCLHCHSTPEKAPAQLLARYGTTRSFDRKAGEVVSAVSIRVPVVDSYAEADRMTLQFGLGLLTLLAASFGLHFYLVRRTVLQPVSALNQRLCELADDPSRLGNEVHVRGARELEELCATFSQLSGSLAEHRTGLEELVAQRTRQLDIVNHELREEIAVNRQQQQELSFAREQAEMASRVKSEFLANMSHELRTPMNGVLGMLQLLNETPLTDEQHKFVELAISSGWNLTRLLNEILDLSRMESGKMLIEKEPVPLQRLLAGSLDLFKHEIAEKSLTVASRIDPALPPLIIGDETRLRQILINLIGNAVKFTAEGGIVVELRQAATPSATEVVMEMVVRDSGIGIEPEQLRLIFEPFHHGEGVSQKRFRGAGLGLSIVNRLAAMMHGTVTIESQPGVGTTVRVQVMVGICEEEPAGASGVAEKSPPVASSVAPTGLRILLAEDNEINREVMQLLLATEKHRVTTAANGRMALQALAGQEFDVVLMDIQMPEMDGIEALRRLRAGEAGERNRQVAVIAMTAYAVEGDRERLLAAGMDDYISKPVDWADLCLLLGRHAPSGAGHNA